MGTSVKNVLMLYDRFPPYNVSGSARPYYFALHLPQFGYAPTVVSSRLLASEAADWSLLDKLPQEVSLVRVPLLLSTCQDAIERWLSKIRLGKTSKEEAGRDSKGNGGSPPAASRRGGWATAVREWQWLTQYFVDWNVSAFVASLRFAISDAEVIWVTAPHFRNAVPAYALSVFSGKPLVVDLRDPWTYGSLWQPGTPRLERWERALAERILGHAARVVVTSPLTAAEFLKRFPTWAAEKIVTITNGYAAAEVEPTRGGHEGKLLLRYVGILNERRTPDVLLNALREVLKDDQIAADMRFEFIGSMGPHGAKLDDPSLHGAVKSFGKVSYQESVALMRGSDVNVILQTISEGQDVIAGKTFEYLATGRPILAVVDAAGGDAWLLKETGAGLVMDWRDTIAIATALRELWTLWKQGKLQQRFTQAGLSNFSRYELTRKLSTVLDDVLGEHA